MLGRNAWFRKDLKQGIENPYSVEGYQMLSAVKHELYGSRVLFPPSTKMMFTFTKQSSGWYLMTPPGDSERYKFHLSNCVLLVKLCTLNDPIYRSLVTRLEKEDIIMYYRRLAVKTEILHAHSIYYESNNLFPDTSAPLRVYFALVKNKSMGNSYHHNPYNFLRSLKVESNHDLSGINPTFVTQEALHYKQLEILQKQQEENQRIFNELQRLTYKEQKRKEKAKQKKLQKRIITQTDGNDSEEPSETTSKGKIVKGKAIPGRNVTKRSVRSKPQNNNTALTTTPETGKDNTNDLANFEHKKIKVSKTAKQLLSCISESESDTTDDTYDYNDSFINDETETESEDDYDTALSNATGIASCSQTASTQEKKNNSLITNQTRKRPKNPTTPPLPLSANQNIYGSDSDVCYVESFSLDVNSKPLDQFLIPATKVSCVSDYVRFLGNLFYSLHWP